MAAAENPFGPPPLKAALSTLKGMAWAALGIGVIAGAGVIGVTLEEAKKLDAAFQFTAPGLTNRTDNDSIAAFGPFREDSGARTLIAAQAASALPSSRRPTATLNSIAPSLAALRANAAQLDAAIETCKRQPADCVPEVQQYQAMIEQVRRIPDKLTQAKTINGWVNTTMLYDQDIVTRARAHQPYSLPSTLGALTKGSGICDHQAELKLYALSKVGFRQDDVRFAVLMQLDEGKWITGHAVVLARIDGKNYVLNNQSTTDEIAPYHQTYLPLAKTGNTLDYNAALQTPAQALNLGLDAPHRQNGQSMIPLYAMNYVSAQPYRGVQDREEPPYYRGEKIDRPFLIGTRTESLGVNFADIAPAYRPIVQAVLDKAINRYVGVEPQPRTDTLVMPAMIIRARPSGRSAGHAPAL